MKRLFFTLCLSVIALSALSVPAKKGVWKELTLTDGTTVRAQLVGDEFSHFWLSADGKKYIASGDTYVIANENALRLNAMRRKARKTSAKKRMRKAMASSFTGKKKGLIILVQFSNVSFQPGHDKAKYEAIANQSGYTTDEGFRGSVKDYFIAQSDSLFELDFDVIGPVTLQNSQSYYGRNDYNGNDMRPGEMVAEACKAIADSVDFKDYDWDKDGYVDQVFVLYAGKGEADSQIPSTVWPHEWSLENSDYGTTLTLDSVTIDTYACANELQSTGLISGIGTVCHEFSHCLGFPDVYDTNYEGYFGMGNWDIMCGGSYNNDGFCPPAYTSYERMVAGWLKPTELTSDTIINDLRPLSGPKANAYIIYNQANKNEFYLLENRQQKGWDAALAASGMLILHVDYDSLCWENNAVNSLGTYSAADGYSANFTNDHERYTIFHADNDDDKSYWNATYGFYSKTTEEGDPYPYDSNDSLTSMSTPVAKVYNHNTDNTNLMGRGVQAIAQLDNGNMSFKFDSRSVVVADTTQNKNYYFYESFDKCSGKGGNDNVWKGINSASQFLTDNTGWQVENPAFAYGADSCARFGSSKNTAGTITTPTFTIDGTAKFSFKAGAWDDSKTDTDLAISVSNGFTLDKGSETTESLEKGKWVTYTYTLTGTGSVSVSFLSTRRFFLDEVKAEKLASTGIRTIATVKKINGHIFNLQGQYVGNDVNGLQPGIYIRDGKKIVVR